MKKQQRIFDCDVNDNELTQHIESKTDNDEKFNGLTHERCETTETVTAVTTDTDVKERSPVMRIDKAITTLKTDLVSVSKIHISRNAFTVEQQQINATWEFLRLIAI